jgi:hypothetical protein
MSGTVSNCIVSGNSNKGIDANGCIGIVINCIVRDYGGDGIYGSGQLTVKNSLIYDNNIGIKVDSCTQAYINNCTVIDNAEYGISAVQPYGTPSVKNCILQGNGADLNLCSAQYSCIGDAFNPSAPNFAGSINADALFVDSEANNFRLSSDSPCINAGEPGDAYISEKDMDGKPRIIDSRIDMGAYEFSYIGDFNLSGAVDFDDLCILAGQWLQGAGIPSADIAPSPNGDGRVNFLDFALMAKDWMK